MAKNSEAKKFYDWENDPELTTREPEEEEKSLGEVLNETFVAMMLLALIFFALVVASNYFFGPHTYFVSYNYTLEGYDLFWGSGQTFVSYNDKVDTSNCNSFISSAKKTIEKELGKDDGKTYNAVIVSYQEVPRSITSLLRF